MVRFLLIFVLVNLIEGREYLRRDIFEGGNVHEKEKFNDDDSSFGSCLFTA